MAQMDKRNRRSSLRAALAVGALALLTAGCAQGMPGYFDAGETRMTGVAPPKLNQIEYVKMSHEVRFAPGSAELSPAEKTRLTEFLDRIRAGFSDRFVVDAGPSRGVPDADELARQREEAVAAFLQRRFLRVLPPVQDTVEGAMARNSVFVIAGRHVVTLPNCPDWSKATGADFTNTPGSNYGCATVSNLGMMVADPGDLLAGRENGPADGQMMIRGVERYRKGEVSETLEKKAPPIVKVQSAQ